MLHLAAFLRQRYYCTFYDALHAILPAGLWFRAEEQYMISPALPEDWQASLPAPRRPRRFCKRCATQAAAPPRSFCKRWQDPQQLQRLLHLLREKGLCHGRDKACPPQQGEDGADDPACRLRRGSAGPGGAEEKRPRHCRAPFWSCWLLPAAQAARTFAISPAQTAPSCGGWSHWGWSSPASSPSRRPPALPPLRSRRTLP